MSSGKISVGVGGDCVAEIQSMPISTLHQHIDGAIGGEPLRFRQDYSMGYGEVRTVHPSLDVGDEP